MKLFTHNLMKCNAKKCTNNYPLKINPTKTETQPSSFNIDFMAKFLKKVDVTALMAGAKDLGVLKADYSALKEEDVSNVELMRELFGLLFEVVLVDGELVCNGCGLVYPVRNGIADMVIDD